MIGPDLSNTDCLPVKGDRFVSVFRCSGSVKYFPPVTLHCTGRPRLRGERSFSPYRNEGLKVKKRQIIILNLCQNILIGRPWHSFFFWMSSEFLALTRSSTDKGAHLLCDGTGSFFTKLPCREICSVHVSFPGIFGFHGAWKNPTKKTFLGCTSSCRNFAK